jgi:hypothetical protein
MFLGTVDDWTAEGTVVSWYPTEASHACAADAGILLGRDRLLARGRIAAHICLRPTKLSAESISKRTARSRNRAKQEGVVRDDGG